MDGANKTDVSADETLTLTRVFDASREKVWHAWTDQSAVAAWFGPEGVSAVIDIWEFRVGGSYHLVMSEPDGEHPLRGEFVKIIEGEFLALTWTWEHGEMEGIETLVEVNLTDAVDGGTELTLTHTKLPNSPAAEKHAGGWTSCLDSLAAALSA